MKPALLLFAFALACATAVATDGGLRSNQVLGKRLEQKEFTEDLIGGNTELQMGITDLHQKKLQEWVNEYNIPLFLRVSDPASVNLVKTEKFACKSVDIHDKSSNW